MVSGTVFVETVPDTISDAVILAIDAGNTRIKWGVHDGHSWSATGAIATAQSSQLYESLRPALRVDVAIASNVAGERVQSDIKIACDRADLPVTIIRPERQQLGVVNGYRAPAPLGA